MGSIVVNGKTRSIDAPVPLLTILRELELEPKWALIEINGQAVPRTDYETKQIEPGDRIEIATPMAGG